MYSLKIFFSPSLASKIYIACSALQPRQVMIKQPQRHVSYMLIIGGLASEVSGGNDGVSAAIIYPSVCHDKLSSVVRSSTHRRVSDGKNWQQSREWPADTCGNWTEGSGGVLQSRGRGERSPRCLLLEMA